MSEERADGIRQPNDRMTSYGCFAKLYGELAFLESYEHAHGGVREGLTMHREQASSGSNDGHGVKFSSWNVGSFTFTTTGLPFRLDQPDHSSSDIVVSHSFDHSGRHLGSCTMRPPQA